MAFSAEERSGPKLVAKSNGASSSGAAFLNRTRILAVMWSKRILVARLCEKAERFTKSWLIDREGGTTDDPSVLMDGGSILPVGGLDHGHKGFGLSLLVEELTQGLGGYGRADHPGEWGASVFILALSAAASAGPDALRRQTAWLVQACLGSNAIDPASPVRIPGQLALSRKSTIRLGAMVRMV